MATVPPLDNSGPQDDLSEIARRAFSAVIEGMAESVTSANPALETTTSTQQVGHPRKNTANIDETSEAGVTPASHGIENSPDVKKSHPWKL